MNIAVAGKGGTGKTTFTSLLIRTLLKNGERPIFAVDADANANLNEALGFEVHTTISKLLQDFKDMDGRPPGGMDKMSYMQYQITSSLVEEDDVDLLVMGGPLGPGCYCYPNDLLKKFMEDLSSNYPYVIMDNEAGLEHLSRRTTQDIDILFVISDSSARGIRSAGRVKNIVDEIDLDVDEIYLVVTKVDEELIEMLEEEIEKTGLELIGTVPQDRQIMEYDLKGMPLIDLPDDSVAVQAIEEIVEKTVLD
ncbi:ATP-binding protein [Fuchsiella alkaliacetigena]|uniref:ATP-binding protein n=1 Tax=Fuchsiella alkaliacetigena TaxID=957042 RepID=UPI00200B5E62|nr:AAA family ATPase [Fuchsiella alkaliacetigena]MCK8825849.1 AAA family ATPase [Fuchsiella alkaliacetigena]